jgi:hypothetical protein
VNEAKELLYKNILIELYQVFESNPEGAKIISRQEFSKDISVSIAYGNLEALEYLTIKYSGTKDYAVKITDLGKKHLLETLVNNK